MQLPGTLLAGWAVRAGPKVPTRLGGGSDSRIAHGGIRAKSVLDHCSQEALQKLWCTPGSAVGAAGANTVGVKEFGPEGLIDFWVGDTETGDDVVVVVVVVVVVLLGGDWLPPQAVARIPSVTIAQAPTMLLWKWDRNPPVRQADSIVRPIGNTSTSCVARSAIGTDTKQHLLMVPPSRTTGEGTKVINPIEQSPHSQTRA